MGFIVRRTMLFAEFHLSPGHPMPAKKGCTPAMWLQAVTQEALGRGLSPAKVLGGSRYRIYTHARQAAMCALVRRGFSYNSIGAASGFDRTTIYHAWITRETEETGKLSPRGWAEERAWE